MLTTCIIMSYYILCLNDNCYTRIVVKRLEVTTMISKSSIGMLEQIGYVNNNGKHIYGTAALLHILHSPVSKINAHYIEQGKKYIEKLSAV